MTFPAGVITIKEDSALTFRISTIPKDKKLILLLVDLMDLLKLAI